jgi:putative component of membrane protein insertase Oxa1/YidC/SpoIIIJ protein YidD
MNDSLHVLTGRLRGLEEEIESELRRRRQELNADFEGRRVRFEQEVLAAQRRLKQGLMGYLIGSPPLVVLTAPIIYSGIVPLLLLDLFLTFYQAVCFPLYGIAKVRRRDYFVFDRAHLAYLNAIEKFNCAYCSYGNGVAAYFREVIARTEQFWCPIKHARRILHAHPYYHGFTDFGDAEAYTRQLRILREELGKHR